MEYVLALLLIFTALYPKTNIWKIFVLHLGTLYNAKNHEIEDSDKKIYYLDIIVFFFIPLIITLVLVYGFNLVIEFGDLTKIILSVFLPILFGILALLNSLVVLSKESSYKLFVLEVFYNVAFSTILSIILLVLVIVNEMVSFSMLLMILILYLIIVYTLNMLLIIKRIYKLIETNIKHKTNQK